MIIDTHTHFYDISRPEHYWPPRNSDLYRTCLPEDYKALAEPLGVSGTVVVEASPQMVDNEWILSLAEKDTFIKGFVGNIGLGSVEFAGNLARLATNPLFVGIRANWWESGQLLRPEAVDDLKDLADRNLELDILCGVPALLGLPELRSRVPGLRVVINHVAGVRIDGGPPDQAWANAIRPLADYPEVFCKVSGLVEAHQGGDASRLEDYVPTLDFLWDVFGEDRVIYGSNWPVCERVAACATVQSILTRYLKRKGESAARKYFYENSRKAYRWLEREP
jgi:L-fuconolactonase